MNQVKNEIKTTNLVKSKKTKDKASKIISEVLA